MRGTLVAEYRTCGNPRCGCATDKAKRHGPYWYLRWREGRRVRRRYVPAAELDEVRARIETRRAEEQAVRDASREVGAMRIAPRSSLALGPDGIRREPETRPQPESRRVSSLDEIGGLPGLDNIIRAIRQRGGG